MSIKQWRLELDESVEELARAFNVTPSEWLRYEDEGAPPELERELEKLAKMALNSRESRSPGPWPFPTEIDEPKAFDPAVDSEPYPYCLTGALGTVEKLRANGIRAEVSKDGRVNVLDEVPPQELERVLAPTIQEAPRAVENEAMRTIVSLQNQLRASEEAHDTTLLLVRFFCCFALAVFIVGKDNAADAGMVLLPLFLVVEGFYRWWKSKDD